MLDRAYVLKDNGDAIYGRSFIEGEEVGPESIPPHVRACAMLLHSSSSTSPDRSYTLGQDDALWVYAFFDRFAIVLKSKNPTAETTLKKMVLSIGRDIARNYGSTIASWSGDFGEVEGFDSLVRSYARMDFLMTNPHMEHTLQVTIDRILESYPVAYAGVLNVLGDMVRGNIPEEHLSHLRGEILNDTLHIDAEMVPTTLQVFDYDVQVLGVGAFTIAVAPYRGDGRIQAVQAAGDIAHTLESLLDKQS
jgi:hypothetical protein